MRENNIKIEIAFFNGVASGNDILLELLHVKRHHYLVNNYIFTCTFKTFNRLFVQGNYSKFS